MLFDNIFKAEQLAVSIEREYRCKIAEIPFMDCRYGTSYWISEDGKQVFVAVKMGTTDNIQVRKLKIVSVGVRCLNSAQSFRRRNNKGKQTEATIPAAVYGAFILKDRLPKFRLKHLDNNPNNCHVNNLSPANTPRVKDYVCEFSYVYHRFYKYLVRFAAYYLGPKRQAEAEDIVSESFIRLCHTEKELKSPEKIWCILVKDSIKRIMARNKEDLCAPGFFDDLIGQYETDQKCCVGSLRNLIPRDSLKVIDLITQGYSKLEIANKLGCSDSTIRRLIDKSKKITKHGL